MRFILASLLGCTVLASSASAAVLKAEELATFTTKVMAKVGKGDLAGAFAEMKPYTIVPSAEFETLKLGTKSQRDMVGGRFGKTIGHECFGAEKRGESLIRITCIEKTEKHALPWRFYFYRTPTGWVLNSFYWNDQLPALFPPT
jgi:succinate dehydrogenase/fumarate reductase flavoprotein subunit